MQICAVLAAVTEVIRSQGGKETETEYFAALVSGCDSVGVGVQSNLLLLATRAHACYMAVCVRQNSTHVV